MKLSCDKSDFQKNVSLAERNSSKNPTLPILSAILLSGGKNKLHITSTNLETAFESNISAKVEKEGEVAAPAKPLLSLLSSIPDDNLSLKVLGGNLELSTKTSSSKIKCMPVDDFPVVPKVKKDYSFKIPSGLLISSLKRTIGVASLSNTKPELASVFVFSQNQTPITFVATDSFRLAEQKTTFPTPPLNFLIPQKSAQEIVRIFEDEAGEVEVVFNNNQASFSTPKMNFICRLTEGKFPDYQSIIPKSFATQITLDRNEVLNSVKTASIFSSRLSEIVLKTNSSEGFLEVRSSHSDTGEHVSLCQAKITGEETEATFNYHYLLDALQHLSSPKVFLGLNGNTKAAILRGFEDSSYFHLVMPMRGV